jgi:hypothetical protein
MNQPPIPPCLLLILPKRLLLIFTEHAKGHPLPLRHGLEHASTEPTACTYTRYAARPAGHCASPGSGPTDGG